MNSWWEHCSSPLISLALERSSQASLVDDSCNPVLRMLSWVWVEVRLTSCILFLFSVFGIESKVRRIKFKVLHMLCKPPTLLGKSSSEIHPHTLNSASFKVFPRAANVAGYTFACYIVQAFWIWNFIDLVLNHICNFQWLRNTKNFFNVYLNFNSVT